MNFPRLDGASDEPLYNIGIVARMTGIPVATLRVWERRYGFPQSSRTPGGHRLTSEREVARLRWVKARVDEGMQTGQAIRALQHLEQQGRSPEAQPSTPPREIITDASLSAYRDRLTAALLVNDLALAGQLLADVLGLYPLESLLLEVLIPTLNAIGMAWLNDEINVATEHLATNFLRQQMLMWMNSGPQPYAGVQPLLLACAPDEWHEGSLMALGVLLRRRRWPVAYLGQNMPLKDLAQIAKQMNTPGIVLVAMLEAGARALTDWPFHLPDAQRTGRPVVAYGGLIFNEQPEWRDRVPGMFLGETLGDGVDRLEAALRVMLPL